MSDEAAIFSFSGIRVEVFTCVIRLYFMSLIDHLLEFFLGDFISRTFGHYEAGGGVVRVDRRKKDHF